MRYVSTRDKNREKTSAEAIARGLSEDGGLYTPEYFPVINEDEFLKISDMNYPERAAYILSMLLEDFTREELLLYTKTAYERCKFDGEFPAPLRAVDGKTHFLELWHGPTCAFKDMALQMLPHLLTASLRKTGEKKTACILVATSGDTGSAALNGFRDVLGTKILVFYPKDGISEIQELQMTTMEGSNVGACAVYGNFDDTQTGVKAIFSDKELATELSEKGYFLSSANSINWGRVAPQIVYYISAYCDLFKSGDIKFGDKVNFCVPTGNFGNILSAYYAGLMGVPLGKLICASNSNNVLTDFIKTGKYESRREFHTTISPSMDILISSNLERLLFSLSGYDGAQVNKYMDDLRLNGAYEVKDEIKNKISRSFYSGYCDDEETKRTLKRLYDGSGYLIDPHTAVAYGVLQKYREETGDGTLSLVVSTASPFKFSESVLKALGEYDIPNGVEQLKKLSERTNINPPAPLMRLGGAKVRFRDVSDKPDMALKVKDMLNTR